MNISVLAPNKEVETIIRQLLLPWHVHFSIPEKAELIITYQSLDITGKPTIIIPSETYEFRLFTKKNKIRTLSIQHNKLIVSISENFNLCLTPLTQNIYDISRNYDYNKELITFQLDNLTYLLPIDIIKEYCLKMEQVLHMKISEIYQLIINFPIQYTRIPQAVRNFLFTRNSLNFDFSYTNFLDFDAIRYLLLSAIKVAIGRYPYKKMWNGFKFVSFITHDIDTRAGLQKSSILKKIEEKYDIPSTWYIPIKRYKLHNDTILNLANFGEIGVHGTKHDGKLIQLSETEAIKRLKEGKLFLEKIIQKDIIGFRAPLLQHNENILVATKKSGYRYDSSIPTWEPKHPATMGPHGIGTVYPLNLNGLIEIPVSIPQDYQMLYVMGKNVEDTIKIWISYKKIIEEIGGLYTVLIHPEYDLTNHDNIYLYEEFLNVLASDDNLFKTHPKNVVDILIK